MPRKRALTPSADSFPDDKSTDAGVGAPPLRSEDNAGGAAAAFHEPATMAAAGYARLGAMKARRLISLERHRCRKAGPLLRGLVQLLSGIRGWSNYEDHPRDCRLIAKPPFY
jgi:hypothetical protein